MILLEIVKTVGSVVGTVLSCITLLTIAVKPVRQWLANYIMKNSKTNETIDRIDDVEKELISLNDTLNKFIDESIIYQNAIKSSNEAILGNMIKSIYNQFRDTKKIPEHEYQMIEKLYKPYHEVLKGNSVVEHIYNEITGENSEWEIIIE